MRRCVLSRNLKNEETMVRAGPQPPPPQITFFALIYSKIHTKYVEWDKNMIMNDKEKKIRKKTIVVYLEIKTLFFFNILNKPKKHNGDNTYQYPVSNCV